MTSPRLIFALALPFAFAGCPAPCDPAWELALDGSGGPLLAAWGRGADDAWLVGGGMGQGPARIVRWTGQPRDVAGELGVVRDETLWWIWGAPDGTLWMVGERGLVLHGPADGSTPFVPIALPAPTQATLYGVWGRSAADVWIVGGIPDQVLEADDDLVLHWDGVRLTRVDVPVRGAALFKVWGAPDVDELWIVGENGTMWLRRDGVWIDHARSIPASVLTVHGCSAAEVYAVGGRHVWQWDGVVWDEVSGLPSFALAAGVVCGRDDVLVIGAQGLRLRKDRASGAWTDDQLAPFVDGDLHGAWAAPEGELFAAGGDYLLPSAAGRGLIVRRGCR